MKKHNYYLSLFFLLSFVLQAQVNTYSPYSYFGLGSIYSNGSIINNSLGGLGASLEDAYILNHVNPASYSALNMTSFEVGLTSSSTEMFQNNLTQKNFTASLLNIGIGFPISDKIGLAFALSPYSTVGYSVNSTVNKSIIGDVNYNYSGSGGLNKLLFGASYELIDGLKIGFNMNYLFGSLDRETVIYSTSSTTYFRDNNSSVINDISPELGLIYSTNINNNKINFGFVFKPEKEIQSRTDVFQHTFSTSGDYEYFLDTISDFSNDSNYLTLPLEFNTGLSVEFNNKLLLGVDYHYTNWSNYTFNNLTYAYLIDNNNIVLGGSYTPNKLDIHSYFNRVQYKIGLSYSSGYLDLNQLPNQPSPFGPQSENVLKDLSISMGLSLPINKVFSMAHVGVKYGTRGYTANNFIEERYFNLYMSMTLNDKWFNKRKIQ